MKREELVSLAERLDSKTLKLTDLTLSGEGGFGFQQQALSQAGSGEAGGGGSSSGGSRDERQDNDNDDDEGGLLERGADAGRGLLKRAKGVVGG